MNASAVDPWILELFRAIDAKDVATFAGAFTDDGYFRFANSAPVVGRELVGAALAGFYDAIGGLRHEILGVWSGRWEGGDVHSVESTVTYTRTDGSHTEPLPVTTTMRRTGDLIADYRIFMDIAPLFASER
ncbi:MAG: nuclear transport factor 2 family protein [Sporichthyaceae bacterium]|jgi:hypothetical protein